MSGLHRIFVFGTLKEGFPNFHINGGRRLPGTFATVLPYPLYLVGERHSPWLLDAPGQGHRVRGQVFEVDGDALARMDALERIHEPDGYRRVRIVVDIEDAEASGDAEVDAYLKDAHRLGAIDVRLGPLTEYTLQHAALYRQRS